MAETAGRRKEIPALQPALGEAEIDVYTEKNTVAIGPTANCFSRPPTGGRSNTDNVGIASLIIAQRMT